MPDLNPELQAVLVSLGGGGLTVLAVYSLGVLYSKLYNRIRRHHAGTR